MRPVSPQITMTETAPMKAQAVPRTAEVFRAAMRKASWTRQKMSRLSGFSRGFRLLALVAMATIASLEQCGLRVFLRDYSRKQMKLRGSMTIFIYDRAYDIVPISKFALSSRAKFTIPRMQLTRRNRPEKDPLAVNIFVPRVALTTRSVVLTTEGVALIVNGAANQRPKLPSAVIPLCKQQKPQCIHRVA